MRDCDFRLARRAPKLHERRLQKAVPAAAGIVRRLIWRVKAGDRSRVIDAAKGNFSSVTVDHVLNGARDGDGVAISVVRDTAKYLGMAAANMVAVADPDMLVLGGITSQTQEGLESGSEGGSE